MLVPRAARRGVRWKRFPVAAGHVPAGSGKSLAAGTNRAETGRFGLFHADRRCGPPGRGGA